MRSIAIQSTLLVWCVGCARERATPPAQAPAAVAPVAPSCGPLEVLADGVPIADAGVSSILGEDATGTDGVTHRYYAVEIRSDANACDYRRVHGLAAANDADPASAPDADLSIRVELTATDSDQYAWLGGVQVAVRGRVLVAPARAGDVGELCIEQVGPVRATSGPLAGKLVIVRGRVRATYCGSRSEMLVRFPEDRG